MLNSLSSEFPFICSHPHSLKRQKSKNALKFDLISNCGCLTVSALVCLMALGWMLNEDNEALWRLDVELLFSRTDFPAILTYQRW